MIELLLVFTASFLLLLLLLLPNIFKIFGYKIELGKSPVVAFGIYLPDDLLLM